LFDCPSDAATEPAGKPICGGKRFIEIPGRDQRLLEARCVEDFVPEGAFVRAVDEIVEMLDFWALEGRYPGGGRPAFAGRSPLRRAEAGLRGT